MLQFRWRWAANLRNPGGALPAPWTKGDTYLVSTSYICGTLCHRMQ